MENMICAEGCGTASWDDNEDREREIERDKGRKQRAGERQLRTAAQHCRGRTAIYSYGGKYNVSPLHSSSVRSEGNRAD